MQRGLSKTTRKAIIKNHLQGLDQQENLKSVNSAGSNSVTQQELITVIDEFGAEAEKKGLDSASKEHGLSNIARELGEVAIAKRESGVDLASMLEGAKIAAALKKFGAGMPEFEQFLQSVYSRALEKGYTPKEIILQSAKLASLEERYGLGFDKLKEDFEETAKSLVAKKKEASLLDEDIAQKAKKRSELFMQYSMDEQIMRDYIQTKNDLTSLGFQVSDLQGARAFLSAIKGEKFDPAEIMEKLQSISDLQAQKHKAQQDLARVIKDLEEKKTLLAEIRRLEESKLTIEQIEKIRSSVMKISGDQKIDLATAYSRFEQDVLQGYNTVLGLRPEVSRLEENKKRLETEVESRRRELQTLESTHTDKAKRLEEKYAKEWEQIQAYNDLRAQGIDSKRILAWNQIMKNANLDYGTIEGELRNQANLKALEDRESAKIKELLAEELKLTQSVGQLNQEKQKLDASIKAIRDSALGELGKMKESVISSITELSDQAQSKLSETSDRTRKTLEDLRSSSTGDIKQLAESSIGDLKTTVTELKNSTNEVSTELKSLLETAKPDLKEVGLALAAGEKIGKFRNILPLLKLLDGTVQPADETEALIAMWNLASHFNSWVESKYAEDAAKRDEMSRPLSELLESINSQVQKVGGDKSANADK